MSNGHETPAQAAHGKADADAVDYGKVVGVGVASLIIFAISIAWAGWLMHRRIDEVEAKAGRADMTFDRSRTEIGIVDQVPFSGDKRLHEWRAERRYEETHYSWVDKTKGIVRLPIDVAVDKVASGVMPPGAPK